RGHHAAREVCGAAQSAKHIHHWHAQPSSASFKAVVCTTVRSIRLPRLPLSASAANSRWFSSMVWM
ncbi:hypothetical protein RZA67_16350, partial [Stenotrophomonas sp. C3(2023)]|uniref:hypothetical protein n=1 Tax=Stenotrophomonas sp. C3(2023) TaxID=3080277 RepID=UPI00293C3EB6